MRTVVFMLMNTRVAEVEDCLAARGLERLADAPGRWNYPAGADAVLYMSCGPYDAGDFREEHEEVLRCTGGNVPAVEVQVDISGRVPGDGEIRWFADVLLSAFDGLACDDFLSLKHGWTLDEIRQNRIVDGLGFFDYREAYRRTIGDAS